MRRHFDGVARAEVQRQSAVVIGASIRRYTATPAACPDDHAH